MLSTNIIDILEKYDIKAYDEKEQNNKYCTEIEFFSPAGEDVIFDIWYNGSEKEFVQAFKENATDFDIDEHVEMWVPHRENNGVPNSIGELREDAEWIKSFLINVSKSLEDYYSSGTDKNSLINMKFCSIKTQRSILAKFYEVPESRIVHIGYNNYIVVLKNGKEIKVKF